MADVGWQIVVLLALVAFVAGFIDAIAGGGGLLTLPALVIVGLDPVSAIATNKMQSTFGSGAATLAFARRGFLDRKTVLPLVIAAGLGSILGARLLPYMPAGSVARVLPVALLMVASYFALSPRFGKPSNTPTKSRPFALTAAIPAIGLYDGMFGPGTGSFFMLAFVSLGGLRILDATARTKVANFASNLAGFVAFAMAGSVIYQIGLAMAAAQLAGGWLGAQTSINTGGAWVRPAVVTMSVLLAGKLLFDAFR